MQEIGERVVKSSQFVASHNILASPSALFQEYVAHQAVTKGSTEGEWVAGYEWLNNPVFCLKL